MSSHPYTPAHTSRLVFAPLDTAVPCARMHTTAVLREWGMVLLADDAELIVSELMTNAIDAVEVACPEHPPVTLRLLASDGILLIEIWDASEDDPVMQADLESDSERGRGLVLVEALAVRWGWERDGAQSKVVWAELALPH